MAPQYRKAEPPLNDRELRIVRDMIDERANRLAVDSWLSAGWKRAAVVLASAASLAVVAAAIVDLVKAVA